MAFQFTPSTAASVAVAYGVDHTLADYIIQNLNEGESTQNLEIPDQKGRICQVVAYDKGKSFTFTAIGPTTAPCSAGDQLAVSAAGVITVVSSGGDYIVQNCEKACTYNDTAKWNITCTGWKHATYTDKTDDTLASPITNGN